MRFEPWEDAPQWDEATRSYRLGPSILAAGSAAAAQLPSLERVREEMRSLGQELAHVTQTLLPEHASVFYRAGGRALAVAIRCRC